MWFNSGMKLPSRVKIGGSVYALKYVNEWKGGDNLDGELIQSKKKGNIMYISNDLSDDATWVTLLHEGMHGMNSTMNHEFLCSLSHQMYQFLKDNNFLRK